MPGGETDVVVIGAGLAGLAAARRLQSEGVVVVVEARDRVVGPLHWAGTETAEVWTCHMEGAVRSGERATGEVLGLR